MTGQQTNLDGLDACETTEKTKLSMVAHLIESAVYGCRQWLCREMQIRDSNTTREQSSNDKQIPIVSRKKRADESVADGTVRSVGWNPETQRASICVN